MSALARITTIMTHSTNSLHLTRWRHILHCPFHGRQREEQFATLMKDKCMCFERSNDLACSSFEGNQVRTLHERVTAYPVLETHGTVKKTGQREIALLTRPRHQPPQPKTKPKQPTMAMRPTTTADTRHDHINTNQPRTEPKMP